MDELLKKFVSASLALDKARSDLVNQMKLEGKDFIEVPEGGYIRYWPSRVNENVAWVKKPKVDTGPFEPYPIKPYEDELDRTIREREEKLK